MSTFLFGTINCNGSEALKERIVSFIGRRFTRSRFSLHVKEEYPNRSFVVSMLSTQVKLRSSDIVFLLTKDIDDDTSDGLVKDLVPESSAAKLMWEATCGEIAAWAESIVREFPEASIDLFSTVGFSDQFLATSESVSSALCRLGKSCQETGEVDSVWIHCSAK
jgi:hypothetical protein